MNKPFRIGLCMAGAVSAGAYTAGVTDYLLEALNDWEKRRGGDNVPSHRVTIPIMGGASAGGMTALLAASTINNPIPPVPLTTPDELLKEHPENKLYNSWVDLLEPDMFPRMLTTDDIKSGNVISLLNSQFIDDIAKKMICCDSEKWHDTPGYFESPVKVFCTLSNLEGFDYNVDFNSARQKSKYNMSVHNDYACFEVMDGKATATGKGWMPLDFRTEENLTTARDAAMATGAFPLGLKSRMLERDAAHVNNIPWLRDILNTNPLPDDKKVKTLNVDGGMINNEPFEKVRDLLDEMTVKARNLENASMQETKRVLNSINSNYNTFENTVLMIDPFPSAEANKFDFDQGIMSIITKTLGAMTGQMRAKPIDYKTAMEMSDAAQYIISPSREIRDENNRITDELFGEKAIACGALAGFSGFMSKEFRIHDYYLGRFNCETFLRDYFTVPPDALTENPIFREGYTNIDREMFSTDATGERRYQIIPIFSPRPGQDSFAMPKFSSGTTWPALDEKMIEQYDRPLRKRVEKIILNISNLNATNRFLIGAGAKIVLNRLLSGKVMTAIKDGLYEWKLISGFNPRR